MFHKHFFYDSKILTSSLSVRVTVRLEVTSVRLEPDTMDSLRGLRFAKLYKFSQTLECLLDSASTKSLVRTLISDLFQQ